MSTIINGTTVANPVAGPEGCSVRSLSQGSVLEMADGSAVAYYTGETRYAWSLKWVGLTQAEFTALETVALALIPSELPYFSPPYKAVSYTRTIIAPGSFRFDNYEVGDGNQYYDVWLEIEESA